MKNSTLTCLLFSVLCLISITSCKQPDKNFVDQNIEFADTQMRNLLSAVGDSEKLPRSVLPSGELDMVDIEDWTSGFFPGVLWYMYELTNDDYWKQAAETQSQKLLPLQYFTDHHDVGFMMYCSYGNGYRLTQNEDYKGILINSAKSLSTRFRKNAGIIQSWDFSRSWGGEAWRCPVIIDNMMNLELLFFASKVTNDDTFRNIAISHADRTLENHIREDYSSYHVVNYDTISGQATGLGTRQGFADNSTWARGQGWSIYGFTMTYRETRNPKYLEAAQRIADFYIQHPNLPEDKIPYWDFNVNEPGYTPLFGYDMNKYKIIPRDVSAATIAISGMLELSYILGEKGKKYYDFAEEALQSLSSHYLYKGNHSFILDQSVGNFPGDSEITVPLIYADYYFLEALLRYKQLSVK
ncbi:glycoside hydrolase family 88 protein [Bacteroides sp. 51]|uniref:glycoside hydrolase family 88 protein n=1 Tax=Bacteroides sp. 51 TaxID=2302938 RepID=UPI001EF1B9BE|nr:glycoside hydrolase family 88 protein [Bacteroides sp. 51]